MKPTFIILIGGAVMATADIVRTHSILGVEGFGALVLAIGIVHGIMHSLDPKS